MVRSLHSFSFNDYSLVESTLGSCFTPKILPLYSLVVSHKLRYIIQIIIHISNIQNAKMSLHYKIQWTRLKYSGTVKYSALTVYSAIFTAAKAPYNTPKNATFQIFMFNSSVVILCFSGLFLIIKIKESGVKHITQI